MSNKPATGKNGHVVTKAYCIQQITSLINSWLNVYNYTTKSQR